VIGRQSIGRHFMYIGCLSNVDDQQENPRLFFLTKLQGDGDGNENRVARFFLVKHTKMGGGNYVPNDHKIYQHFSFQGPPKCTQSGIFGMKICTSGNPGRDEIYCLPSQ
jgi:hypothetical protein